MSTSKSSTSSSTARNYGSTGRRSDNTKHTSCTDCGCNHTESGRDCSLDDDEIISDVLGCQKSLIKLYGTALCESSCPNLRDIISTHLTECAEDQYDAFLYMNERGLYPTDTAQAPKITQAKRKFTRCEQQMR